MVFKDVERISEKDVALGTLLLREIDKGLAKSRVGIVLVTPALLRRLQGEGIADKELSALPSRCTKVTLLARSRSCRSAERGDSAINDVRIHRRSAARAA